MPGIDDRLRRDLERLAKGAEAPGSLAAVTRRRHRHRTARRFQTAALAAVVLAATAGGGYALTRAFRRDTDDVASPPAVRNGKIAFVSDRDGNREIYVMDASGSNVIRVTDHPGEDMQPTWSPDGRQIAFVSDRSGAREIHVMNADGTGVRRLTESGSGRFTVVTHPDWSPDGSLIAFSAGTNDSGCMPRCVAEALFIAPATTDRSMSWINLSDVDPPVSVAPRYERDPTWSPDGSRILFDSFEWEPLFAEDPGPSDPSGGYLIAADGSDRQPLQPMLDEKHSFQLIPGDWSPIDDRLVFGSRDGIFVGHLVGSSLQNIEKLRGREDADRVGGPVWAPDGTKIAYVVTRGENEDVYVMSALGTAQTNITSDSAASDVQPAWQPLPLGAPTVEPTTPEPTEPSPSPSLTSPGPPPSQEEFELTFGPLCGFTGVFGDFDGDGKQDDAGVAYPRSGETCADDPPDDAWKVFVIWANGASGAWPLDDCDRACRAVAVADLDGNGTDEFFLVVDQGAATVFIHIYELPVGQQPKHPLEVAPPGAEGYPADEPITLPYGGSVTHQDFVTCDEGDGVHILIATSAELDQNQGEWNVHETIFSFDGEAFTVASTRDYQVAYDSSGEDPLPVPGDACFALD